MRRREQEPSTPSIEMAFSKLKAHLRRIGARTIDDLWRAVGSICDLYPPTNAATTSPLPGMGTIKRSTL
jgi:hypothetical protein